MLDHSEATNEATVAVNPQTDSSQNDEAKVERYKQQMKGREEEARLAKEAQKNAEERAARLKQSLLSREYNRVYNGGQIDVNALKSLQKEDPELADELAQQFTRQSGDAISDANDLLNYVSGSISTGSLDKQSLIEEAKKQIMDEIEQRATTAKVTSRFWNLPVDKRQEAEAYYKKIAGGRKLSAEEAQEFADMASMYVMKWQIVSQKRDDNLASMASMDFWGISTNAVWNSGISDADIAEYLGNFGMNRVSSVHGRSNKLF